MTRLRLASFTSFVLPASLALVPILSGLGTGACSSASSPAATGPVARFTMTAGAALPAFMDVPFPNDAYRDATGHLVAVPGVDKVFRQSAEFVTHEMPHMDGFSRAALAMFYIDDLAAPTDDDGNPTGAQIDPASLPADEKTCMSDASSVFLVDLDSADAANPASARLPCRALFHTNINKKNTPLVAVGPGRGFLLDEGHRYAAILTSRIKDVSGKPVAASDTFKQVLAGGGPSALATTADALAKAKAILASSLASDHATIVSIAPYTTHTLTKELFTVRESLEDTPVPTLKWDPASMAPRGAARFAALVNGALPPGGFTASLDAWLGVVDAQNKLPDGSDDPDDNLKVRAHDKIAAVGTGVFDAVNFLQVKADGYEAPDHATFARDASGKIIPAPEKPTAKIWVTIAIPTAPMPQGGYPVVIVQHGLSGSRAYIATVANVFCNKGWAVVGIDSVTFGARAPESKYQVDATTDYAKNPGATYAGPDGIADADSQGNHNGSSDLFGGLKNIGAIRDQMRQAALDTTQLVRVVRSAALDLSPLTTGAAAPKFDASRVAYFGDSLGGIQGAIAAAIEPSIKSWTLNVAGGGLLIETAAHGPAISALVTLAALANFGFSQNTMNEAHPMMNMLQLIAEPGDSLIFAPLLVKSPRAVKGVAVPPRNILQFEVVWDELVSNEANEALARAGGWGIATPNVGTNAGVVDFKNPANNPGRMVLPDVAPDATGFVHDTPVAGVTAVIVQVSPAQHGSNLVASTGRRSFGLPWADWSSPTPFNHLDVGKDFTVRCPYRELHETMTHFFDDGFQGKVPNVSVLKPPVRDFDDDGSPDDVDPAPSDPTVK